MRSFASRPADILSRLIAFHEDIAQAIVGQQRKDGLGLSGPASMVRAVFPNIDERAVHTGRLGRTAQGTADHGGESRWL